MQNFNDLVDIYFYEIGFLEYIMYYISSKVLTSNFNVKRKKKCLKCKCNNFIYYEYFNNFKNRLTSVIYGVYWNKISIIGMCALKYLWSFL